MADEPETQAEQLETERRPEPEAHADDRPRFAPDKATLTVTKGKVSLTSDIDVHTGKGVEDLLDELERRSTPQCEFGEDGRCVASQVPRWAIEAGEAECPVHGGLPKPEAAAA